MTAPTQVDVRAPRFAAAVTAVVLALALVTSSGWLVTGSLYLIGNIRGRWYPDDAVLLQRSPWPHRIV